MKICMAETTAPAPRPDFISTLLDIDVFVQSDSIDETTAWSTIERLRDEKNRAFEACITDKLRELIK